MGPEWAFVSKYYQYFFPNTALLNDYGDFFGEILYVGYFLLLEKSWDLSIVLLKKITTWQCPEWAFWGNLSIFSPKHTSTLRHGNFFYEGINLSRIHLTFKNIYWSIKHVKKENPFKTRPWMSIFGEISSVFA